MSNMTETDTILDWADKALSTLTAADAQAFRDGDAGTRWIIISGAFLAAGARAVGACGSYCIGEGYSFAVTGRFSIIDIRVCAFLDDFACSADYPANHRPRPAIELDRSSLRLSA